MRRYFYALISLLICNNVYGADTSLKDEIVFFNVGQGHAELVYKAGHVPLIIDAGSDSRPNTVGEMYEWTKFEEDALLSRISDKILDYWKNFNHGTLQGGKYSLNIIVTHPDKDHKDFVPSILAKLREAALSNDFHFSSTALLGGTEAHYLGYSLGDCGVVYSAAYLGLHTGVNFGFLASSNCLTHLFCPQGTNDSNRWSIVARLQIDGISIMLTGDADEHVKKQMITALNGNGASLSSDILLAPHHGSDVNTFFPIWDQAVNPRAIVIGAAPNQGQRGNRHPRGETIHQLLSIDGTRIWTSRVMPHCILYNCDQRLHASIQDDHFANHQRLFDLIPNNAVPTGEGANKWQVAWVDVPLYTLWTTGTLIFSESVDKPQFIDAPNGLMTYIGVPNFRYLLPPEQRDKNPTLISLMDLFLVDGVGGEEDMRQLTQTVATLSTEGVTDLVKKGINLTEELSLYQNKNLILRALLEMPPTERQAILDLAKPLIRRNTKNFSARYRILRALSNTRSNERQQFIQFLGEHSLLVFEDAFATAKAMESFSHISLDEAQELIKLIYPIYQAFDNLSDQKRYNVLNIIQPLSQADRKMRPIILQHVYQCMMPKLHNETEDYRLIFHDASDNGSLISMISNMHEENIKLFCGKIKKAWKYLTADRDTYLYPENKHFFIRYLLEVPNVKRLKFLAEVLPLMSHASKCVKGWQLADIVKKVSSIYEEQDFFIRLQYITSFFSQKIGLHLDLFELSKIHAEKHGDRRFRLLYKNPILDCLNSIAPGELGIYLKKENLYCKITGKEEMEIEEISLSNPRGIDSNVFNRLKKDMKKHTIPRPEDKKTLLEFTSGKGYM